MPTEDQKTEAKTPSVLALSVASGSAAVDYSCPECGDFQVIHSHSKLNETCPFCGAKVTAKSIAFVGVKQDRTWLTANLANKITT